MKPVEHLGRRKLVRFAVLACGVAVLALGLSVSAPASGAPAKTPAAAAAGPVTPINALSTGTPGVSVIQQNGFGDRNNSWAWSMQWFKGKLYVGTGRDELCVENATIQFFYPTIKGYYNPNPSPGVRCPGNPYDMSLQAQIWQYTPGTGTSTTTTVTKKAANGTTTTTTTTSKPATGSWQMVYRSPVENNPLAKGKTVARDFAYRGMVSWSDPQGQQALFVAGVTPDEYIPPLLRSHPPVILRSFDGIHWTALHLPAVVVHFPNGNLYPMGFRSLLVWRNHLFVTATPDITGDGALFEVTNPWSDHPGLRQVSGPQYDIFEIATFKGGLYIGTGNKSVGYGVYRTFGYTSNGFFNFQQVVGNGAGRGELVNSVVSMYPYHNRLYVGASGWYNQNVIPASELIRIAPDGQWTLVAGNPRNLPNGQTMYPVSGLYDGFFSPFAAHFWRMAQQDGGLFLGTNDWAYLVQENKQYAWLQETVLSGVLGFNIWGTCDGNDWFAVTRNAFGTSEYNFGGRTLAAGGSHGQDLFIGSANQSQGTTIYDDQAQACSGLGMSGNSALAGPAARARPSALAGTAGQSPPARPAALQTDSLRRGTLLSWQRSVGAASYTVERAPMVSVTLGLKPPATLPDGWHTEDAMPSVTNLGAPGSVTVTLSVPGAFSPIGATVNPAFIDHSSGKYVYEIIARSHSGEASAPSNVEIAPFAGPPATFGELRSALAGGVGPAPGATERTALLSARTAQTRLEGLLSEAEAAARHGDDALAARDVAALQAGARNNDTLAAAAARVVRRLEYAGIAGQP